MPGGPSEDAPAGPSQPALWGRYGTIVIDPPWHYPRRAIGGPGKGTFGRGGPLPYPTMTVREIADLPVALLAAPDAVLWLWATNRYLPEAFWLVAGWGFTYRQTLVWGKNNPMPVGAVAPSAAEFLVVGKRGRPRVRRVIPSSVVVTPRPPEARHSTKPACWQDWIEQASPGPRLEMFARRQRLGWDTWGNEALEHPELLAD